MTIQVLEKAVSYKVINMRNFIGMMESALRIPACEGEEGEGSRIGQKEKLSFNEAITTTSVLPSCGLPSPAELS